MLDWLDHNHTDKKTRDGRDAENTNKGRQFKVVGA